MDDFNIFKIIGALIHIFVPHIGSLNTISGQIIARKEITASLWFEVGHWYLKYWSPVIFHRVYVQEKRGLKTPCKLNAKD